MNGRTVELCFEQFDIDENLNLKEEKEEKEKNSNRRQHKLPVEKLFFAYSCLTLYFGIPRVNSISRSRIRLSFQPSETMYILVSETRDDFTSATRRELPLPCMLTDSIAIDLFACDGKNPKI